MGRATRAAPAHHAHRYWLTGNSCNPPCEASDPLFPNCDRDAMGYCGQPHTKAPEEVRGGACAVAVESAAWV
jgi:hypothetical protein